MLNMVDGGDDGEAIPLQPLLVTARGLDTIIAVDGVSDEDNWARGSSIIATAQRAALFNQSYSFPPVPSSFDEFSALVDHPTFFGCSSDSTVPMVIYIPNGAPPPGQIPVTNTSTFTLEYTPQQASAMLDQSYTIATQGLRDVSGQVDGEWGACLACAVVERARQKLGKDVDGVCKRCLARYCWIPSS